MNGFRQRGASTIEFIIVAPVLAMLGLGTIQAGLVYHGNTILNYATFETARTGAVNHALKPAMLNELGTRLAPLRGGDGSAEKAAEAIALSRLELSLQNDVFTHIEILNPTQEAFEHFKVRSRETGVDVIPNSHLRHQSTRIDDASGVNLSDANLLKIRVTHGFDLQVPLVSRLVGAVMSQVDPAHAHYYVAGKMPLTSVATVRMQSEVHGDDLRSASAPPASVREDLENTALVDEDATAVSNELVEATESSLDDGDGAGAASGDDTSAGLVGCESGFGSDPFLPVVSETSCDIAPVGASSSSGEPTSTFDESC